MKVYLVECTNGDERHWIAANDPISAINHAIDEELDEEEDRGIMTATELTDEELDKETLREVQEDGSKEDISMRERLNDAIAEGKEVEVLASTIFYEA